MIKVENLHKYFGDLEVLKGVNAKIDKSEVVCVIGPWKEHVFALLESFGGADGR